ncbi:MAG: MarC family protein [Chlamydiales bacterium]|nr:MarC family protein [Chlamydiales bacterium]
MINDLFHMSFLFLIVMDPLGNVPIFVGVLRAFDPERQRKIIFRELLIALAIMIIFLFFGQGFFRILHVSPSSLQMAGGIILFIIALRMIFSLPGQNKGGRIAKDPLIVPLAVPAVAGPAILATMTLYGGTADNKWLVLLAVFIAWLFLLPTLIFSPYLKKLLGDNGIVAAERLFGYIVVLVSTQMALSGLTSALGR